jgi:hypothetical protein
MWSRLEPKPLPTLRYTATVVAVLLIYHAVVIHHHSQVRSRLLQYVDFDRWFLLMLAVLLLMGVFGDWLGQRRAKPEQYHLSDAPSPK